MRTYMFWIYSHTKRETYEARSKLVAQSWFEMHDYRSLGGGLSFLKVLLKLSGSPGNKLLYGYTFSYTIQLVSYQSEKNVVLDRSET